MTRRTLSLVVFLSACAAQKPFPARDPMWQDGDLASVRAKCHREPTKHDPAHIACAPRVAESRLYWDGMDNLMFRPLSELVGVSVHGEAINVNSLDEVPDSAWFTNRIGRRSMSVADVAAGACTPDDMLDPDSAADGSWVIDRGKAEGATRGFRVVVPGKGKYMLKAESLEDQPERQAASAAIGSAIFHAVGFYTVCEQVLYVRPSILKLMPGLRTKPNFGDEKAFDKKELDAIVADSPTRDGRIRMSASKWVEGHALGPYSSEGTRGDDPNDVVAHEDRRELRGMRVLAAWLDRYDTRRGNTLDTWIADAKDKPDSSPGRVLHYQLDTSETIGGTWPWDPLSRRLTHQYVIDWGYLAADFFTLGIPRRPWDKKTRAPGYELFGYYGVDEFRPEDWKNAYPNSAYSRATERDNAWMARILAHVTPDMLDALAQLGKFTEPRNTTYLAYVMGRRLEMILERYLTRLSPITDVSVTGDRLCGVDLAAWRRIRSAGAFRYSARTVAGSPLAITATTDGKVCVTLEHGRESYVRVAIGDGVAKGKLIVHVYDLGAGGFRLAGVERPD
jgi:hypothetical protein